MRGRGVLEGAAAAALVAGLVTAARPMANLVRRTHAAVTARAEWVRWVKSQRPGTGVGEPAGWISIPAIGIDTIVLLGDTRENLQRYPALLRRSVSFTQEGFVKVVAAHRDTHFRRLGELRTGDRIVVTLKDRRRMHYRVCDTEVVPAEKASGRVAEKDGEEWLVLMTCHPFFYLGPAPDRFLVWARRREKDEPSGDLPNAPFLTRAGGRLSTFSPPLRYPHGVSRHLHGSSRAPRKGGLFRHR